MSDVGTEETSWSSFGDESGDQEYDDAERVGVTALILILFGVGIVVAGGLFFWVYRNESLKKKERAASSTERELKMNPSNTSDSTNKSVTGSAGAQLPENPEERRRAIDEGLITHAWVPDNTTAVPTTSTAEGGGSSDTSTDSTCPICNEVFVEGAMVCSSSNEKCGHVFHKTCMANWLEFQNRCAVCNEAYLSEQA